MIALRYAWDFIWPAMCALQIRHKVASLVASQVDAYWCLGPPSKSSLGPPLLAGQTMGKLLHLKQQKHYNIRFDPLELRQRSIISVKHRLVERYKTVEPGRRNFQQKRKCNGKKNKGTILKARCGKWKERPSRMLQIVAEKNGTLKKGAFQRMEMKEKVERWIEERSHRTNWHR